ncbi:MAG TPA: choice-of-anchor tandem repeat GloVer-containing protein [Bacteroidia bacterium]|jgi:uncharacterized repeat protein (TIGR03803 family)|nr:choice-of-anchor tandem repeat GloVer-containing protein [Bacteroidia bacterium]
MKKIYLALTIAFIVAGSNIHAQNYTLFGTAQNGGANGQGTLFQYNFKSGITTAPVSFSDSIGTEPIYGAMALDTTSGLLLGTTYGGGRYSYGTIYTYGSCGGYQVALNMQTNTPEGENPYGNLAYDNSNGLFYGMTEAGGEYNSGTLFSFNTLTAKYTTILSFNGTNGSHPYGSLTYDPDNNMFYGLAKKGGTYNAGVIFSFAPSTGSQNVVFNFDYTNGADPNGSLTYDPANKLLYGLTFDGGTNYGILFSFDPSLNKENTLVNLNVTNGSYPLGSLLFNPLDSLLYGMTNLGGSTNNGVVFSYNTKTGKDSVRFNMTTAKGGTSSGSFVFNPNDSLLYAMAGYGGVNNQGALFSFNPRNNQDSLLVSFDYTGYNPHGDLLLDTVKNLLYGTNQFGGAYSFGSAFQYNITKGTDSVIINFNDTNGANIYSSFVKRNGILYLLTNQNACLGSNGPGLILSYNPATGINNIVHHFVFSATENNPYSTHLTYYSATGLYYGLSNGGGIYNGGTIYSYDPITQMDKVLFSFNDTIGAYPFGSLSICPSNGLLYGTTEQGGINGSGTIFKFDPSTGITSLSASLASATGYYAYGSLTYCPANGLLYGITFQGGLNGYGALYSLDPTTDSYSDIIDFSGIDGKYSIGSLTYNPGNGMFYGMSNQGGVNSIGDIFMFNPIANTDSLLHSFDNYTGAYPASDVTIDPSDTLLYGVTESGGVNNDGVIFRYNIKSGKDTNLYSFDGITGNAPICNLLMVNIQEAVTINRDTAICNGSSVTLTANTLPGSTYLWNNGATTNSITVSPTIDSTYKIHTCWGIYTNDTSVMVTIHPLPVISIVSGKDTINTGDIDTLVAAGAVSYVWTSGDTKDSAFVSPSTTTTYTVTGTGANGCTDTTSFRVVVNVITGIQSLSNSSASVYPNPANETMYLSFGMKGSSNAVISIMNMNGEEVMCKNALISNGMVMPIDISGLPAGIYFAHIVTGKQTQVVRFVKE